MYASGYLHENRPGRKDKPHVRELIPLAGIGISRRGAETLRPSAKDRSFPCEAAQAARRGGHFPVSRLFSAPLRLCAKFRRIVHPPLESRRIFMP
jgi:hypothetical protein